MNQKDNRKAKKIIILGGSRGIGLQVSKHLLRQGYDVVISSGKQKNLQSAIVALKTEIKSVKHPRSLLLDLSDVKTLNTQLETLNEFHGGFDGVILNAATLGPTGEFEKLRFDEWISAFNVNLFGHVKCLQFLLANSLLNRNSRIIAMSGGISAPDPRFTSFSSTKHALNGFCLSLAHELHTKEIWVNSILPGSFHTKMNEARIERGPDSIGQQNYELCKSRIFEKEEPKYQKLFNLIDWLCSKESEGVFGRLISAQYDDWINNSERLRDSGDTLFKIVRTQA